MRDDVKQFLYLTNTLNICHSRIMTSTTKDTPTRCGLGPLSSLLTDGMLRKLHSVCRQLSWSSMRWIMALLLLASGLVDLENTTVIAKANASGKARSAAK